MNAVEVQIRDVGDVRKLGFADFYRGTAPKLLRAVRRLPRRGDPEEIVQESFTRVWPRWDRVAAMNDPEGYVFRVAINVWKAPARSTELVEVLPDVADHGDERGAVEIRLSLLPAIGRLSERQRAIVTLVGLCDMEPHEVAATLGIAPATARVHLTRARDALRKELADVV